MRYWKLVRHSGLDQDIVLASNEEEAIEILSHNDPYLYDLPPERVAEVLRARIADGDMVLTPICGVGDRVAHAVCPLCGIPHVDKGVGTVIVIGEDVYDLEPAARERDIPDPVLVEWDSGVRSVEDAIDLRAVTEAEMAA